MNNSNKMSKLTLFMIVDVVIIIALMLLIKTYIDKKVNEVEVYRFTQNMPVDTKITDSHVELVKVSASALDENAMLSDSEVVGRYTSQKIYQGEIVDNRKLTTEGKTNALSDLDPQESSKLRKFAVEADIFTTFGGSIGKGDRVDLAYVGKLESEDEDDQKETMYSKVFMENVLVYDVLSSSGESYIKVEDRPAIAIDPNNPDASAAAEAEIASRSDISMVILAVTLEQYEQLLARCEQGQIKVVGRFENSINYETKGFAMNKIGSPVEFGEDRVESLETTMIESKKQSNWK